MSKSAQRARTFPGVGKDGRPRTSWLVHDENLPWAGLEVTGMPDTERLAVLEQEHRFRLNPRRALWPALLEFDSRDAELRARDRETHEALEGARALLRGVDRRDADALARWELDERTGVKPEPERPELEQRIADLEREREGLRTAIGDVLGSRASFVERNRDRLVAVAEKFVDEAQARYVAAVEQLAGARAEVVDLRASELWAKCYPDEAAGQMPASQHLALGQRKLYPANLADRALDAGGVIALLRADAEALARAMTTAQRVLVERLDPRTAFIGDTVWDVDRAGTRAHRYEQLRQAAAQALELPLERVGDIEIERFVRARAAGEV
jgi:hypothetical protein